MGLRDSDRKNVDLVAGILTLEQPADLNLFFIIGRSLVESNSKKELRMTIVMKRKIMSEMMTTYFPSLLLMMITFATTFFKPFFFEAALSVNLTTMLVMTTIFISKMESLPPTSATKMIDYWLILCQLVPFTVVVLLTAMEYQREEKDEKEDPDDVKEANKDPENHADADGPMPEVVLETCKASKNDKRSFRLDLKMIGISLDQI